MEQSKEEALSPWDLITDLVEKNLEASKDKKEQLGDKIHHILGNVSKSHSLHRRIHIGMTSDGGAWYEPEDNTGYYETYGHDGEREITQRKPFSSIDWYELGMGVCGAIEDTVSPGAIPDEEDSQDMQGTMASILGKIKK